MRAIPCRRPNLGDWMILILAIAVVIILAMEWRPAAFRWVKPVPVCWVVCDFFKVRLPAYLAPMTWAALVIRLRAPRPTLRRVFRQAGAIASLLSALVMMAVGVIAFYKPVPSIEHAYSLWLGTSSFMYPRDVLFTGSSSIGPLITGGWLTLALGGRFRMERGWIDAFGLVVGAGWVAVFLGEYLPGWIC